MSQVKKNGPTLLCSLTDEWQSRISEGPVSKGKEIKYRWVIQPMTFCWSLACENASGLVLGEKYAVGFEILVPLFKSVCNLDPEECCERLNKALSEKTGKSLALTSSKTGLEKWIDFGQQLDSFYEVNYSVHGDCRSRLFGESSEESNEE